MTAAQYKDNSGYGIGTWAMPRPRVVEVIIVTSMANMASRAYTNVARHDVTEASSAEFEKFPIQFFFSSTSCNFYGTQRVPDFQYSTGNIHQISESLVNF